MCFATQLCVKKANRVLTHSTLWHAILLWRTRTLLKCLPFVGNWTLHLLDTSPTGQFLQFAYCLDILPITFHNFRKIHSFKEILGTEPFRGKSSESVQCAITGPRLRMRHRPSAQRTVPIRKICPFRSRANSLPGANRPIGPWPIRSLELSLPGQFAPWPFRTRAFSLPGTKVLWNFRSLELSLP